MSGIQFYKQSQSLNVFGITIELKQKIVGVWHFKQALETISSFYHFPKNSNKTCDSHVYHGNCGNTFFAFSWQEKV